MSRHLAVTEPTVMAPVSESSLSRFGSMRFSSVSDSFLNLKRRESVGCADQRARAPEAERLKQLMDRPGPDDRQPERDAPPRFSRILRGNHLSNTTCLRQAFFNSCE